MATRAIIRVAEREEGVSFSKHADNIRTQIYHHWDGYPEGLGCKLAEFLCDFRVVNGLPVNYFEDIKIANGMGCLSAQLVAGLKEEPGRVYIDYPGQERIDVEYTYYIWGTEDKDIWMSIFTGESMALRRGPHSMEGDKCIFVGTPQKLIEKYG